MISLISFLKKNLFSFCFACLWIVSLFLSVYVTCIYVFMWLCFAPSCTGVISGALLYIRDDFKAVDRKTWLQVINAYFKSHSLLIYFSWKNRRPNFDLSFLFLLNFLPYFNGHKSSFVFTSLQSLRQVAQKNKTYGFLIHNQFDKSQPVLQHTTYFLLLLFIFKFKFHYFFSFLVFNGQQ